MTKIDSAISFGSIVRAFFITVALLAWSASDSLAGPEETLSPITAVPAGKITVDGDLSEWDFTGSQTSYVAPEFLEKEHGEFVLAYDRDALYVAARVADVTPMRNMHNAVERFWEGDCIGLRLYTNTKSNQSIPKRSKKGESSQVAHVMFFRQHTTGQVWKHVTYGADFYESHVNPNGVEAAFREFPDKAGYAFEAKIPWSALNVSEPPQPGESMRVLVQFDFGNLAGDRRIRQAPAAYLTNPGDSGYCQPDSWGYMQFAGAPLKKRDWPEPAEVLASFKKPQEGQPISLDLPQSGQLTVNIYDPKTGQLVREMADDHMLPKGPQTLFWDGKDNAGDEAKLGGYTYRALVHQPIKARYLGSVGSSGTPPYQNDAGTGEWGGDLSYPLAVAVDSKGMTLLWPVSDNEGRCVVRLDGEGKTRWRYTPFFDAAGNFYTVASDGDYVYLTYETATTAPTVFRLNAATGEPVFFAKNAKSVDLPTGTKRVATPAGSRPVGFDLIASGMAVDAKHLYVSAFSSNEILVLNKTDASLVKRISVPGPRGVAVGGDGVLFVASYSAEAGRIFRVNVADGECHDVVKAGLSAPWNMAVRANGNLLVTDLGGSQQVKEFAADGSPVRAFGKAGGRACAGAYRAGDYLRPAGIAADTKGGFVVIEAEVPSAITQIDKNDAIVRQWFGPGDYSARVWPDPEDPFLIYSTAGNQFSFIRSVLDPKSGTWRPDAYWALSDPVNRNDKKQDISIRTFADPAFQRFMDGISQPQMVRLGDATYMSSDAAGHQIVRVEGERLVPLADAEARDGQLWIGQDANGNGLLEESEWAVAPGIALPVAVAGKPGLLNGHVGSHTLSPYSGNWYLAAGKTIYRIPCPSFANGKLRFDAAQTKVFIDNVTNGLEGPLFSTYRSGILGMREDAAGNLYVLYTYGSKSAGIGHSSDISRVFLVKFDPQGKRLWEAGRKAPNFAKPGEIYNPWVMAGLLGDKAVAISDESGGMIHFYSPDGFYIGRIFEDFARGDGQPGPYLFNGESFSGQVREFPDRKEFRYMAYMSQMDSRAFVLEGVDAPTAMLTGNVSLSQHYGAKRASEEAAFLSQLAKAPALDGSLAGWDQIAPLVIRSGEKDVAFVRLALSGDNLFFRFEVKDASPLANSEPDPKIAFKGGDTVDLYFGHSGERKDPGAGDVRVLIGLHNGIPTLVGMKPKTEGPKSPQTYSNPAGFKRTFDFVGQIEGAEASAKKSPAGYTVSGRVPLSFFKPLVFSPGTELRFDADVLGSDPSGQKTVTRTFWHSAGDSVLTLTQDLPTEAWLYPSYWGKAVVK